MIDEQELSLLDTVDDELDLSFIDENNCGTCASLNISPINYIKSQISLSKNENVNSGNPSCITSSKSYIIVGTFYGHILVFGLFARIPGQLPNCKVLFEQIQMKN